MTNMMIVRVKQTLAMALLLLASLGAWSSAQDKPKDEKPPGKAKPDAEEAAKEPGKKGASQALNDVQNSQGLGSFGKALPLGEKNIDVKIPSFQDGYPSSTVRAGSMMRVDEENMVMENMNIRLFGNPKEPDPQKNDVRVDLITANYHMPSQILSSDKRSRVRRLDFDLQGDSMVFDTKTQQGKMVGHVQMIIFDSDSFAPQPPADTPKKEKAHRGKPAPKAEPVNPPANEKK